MGSNPDSSFHEATVITTPLVTFSHIWFEVDTSCSVWLHPPPQQSLYVLNAFEWLGPCMNRFSIVAGVFVGTAAAPAQGAHIPCRLLCNTDAACVDIAIISVKDKTDVAVTTFWKCEMLTFVFVKGGPVVSSSVKAPQKSRFLDLNTSRLAPKSGL